MKYAFLLLALMLAGGVAPSMAQRSGSNQPRPRAGAVTRPSSNQPRPVAQALSFNFNGNTIEIGDEGELMIWHDAMKFCQNKKNGWRLPTLEELKAMYEDVHRQGKGNFKNEWYLSCTEDEVGVGWFYNFKYGFANNFNTDSHFDRSVSKGSPLGARCVRYKP